MLLKITSTTGQLVGTMAGAELRIKRVSFDFRAQAKRVLWIRLQIFKHKRTVSRYCLTDIFLGKQMKLYYWNLPFRVIYLELICSYLDIPYSREPSAKVVEKRTAMKTNQNFPGFAPPFVEIDGLSFSQMPACAMYLSEKHNFLPQNAEEKYFCLKTLMDATDFPAELTRNNGSQLWNDEIGLRFLRVD